MVNGLVLIKCFDSVHDHSECFYRMHHIHPFTHSWQRWPYTVHLRSKDIYPFTRIHTLLSQYQGQFYSSLSCPRILHHADCGEQTNDHPRIMKNEELRMFICHMTLTADNDSEVGAAAGSGCAKTQHSKTKTPVNFFNKWTTQSPSFVISDVTGLDIYNIDPIYFVFCTTAVIFAIFLDTLFNYYRTKNKIEYALLCKNKCVLLDFPLYDVMNFFKEILQEINSFSLLSFFLFLF